jgi:hypothetical protein
MRKSKLVGHKGLVIITVKSRLSSLVWLSLCPVVYVWLSMLVVLYDFMGLAVYVRLSFSGCLYLASLSGRLCLYGCLMGTPTKRQVSKRQVSKRLVSKRSVSKRQVYKTSGLQNVRFQIVWFQNVLFLNLIYLLNKKDGNCQVCIAI